MARPPTSAFVTAVPPDLCLAYANTRFWRGRPVPVDRLGESEALFAWLGGPGGLGAPATERLAARARRRPRVAATILADALALREAIYRIFSARAVGSPVAEADVTRLNRALAEAPARGRLVRRDGAYGWRIGRLRLAAPSLLAPVLWSAGDLLVGSSSVRLRRCANDECLWLFLDASKAGTRRWCDMASCGNRAKARRHYLKSKQA
jgi:predicted RNA-binding Zn ribbon-like protein